MASFLTLKNRVATRLIDAPPAVQSEIGDLVNLAIRDLQDDGAYDVMNTSREFTTTLATRELGTLTAADRFKEFREKPWGRMFSGERFELEWLPSVEDALKQFSFAVPTDAGEPSFLTAEHSDENDTITFKVWPLPDGLSDWAGGEYRINIPFKKYIADLIDDPDTNWFTIHAEQYIVAQAVGHGFMVDWDEARAAPWFEVAKNYRRQIKNLGASESVSKTRVLTPRADVNARRDQWRRT